MEPVSTFKSTLCRALGLVQSMDDREQFEALKIWNDVAAQFQFLVNLPLNPESTEPTDRFETRAGLLVEESQSYHISEIHETRSPVTGGISTEGKLEDEATGSVREEHIILISDNERSGEFVINLASANDEVESRCDGNTDQLSNTQIAATTLPTTSCQPSTFENSICRGESLPTCIVSGSPLDSHSSPSDTRLQKLSYWDPVHMTAVEVPPQQTNIDVNDQLVEIEKVRYVCDCGRELSSKANLKRHIEGVHEGRKPFLCTTCDTYFRTKRILAVHERIHSGEKPYACTKCDKQFNQPNSLRKHEQTHKVTYDYKCDVCDRLFRLKDQLTTHMLRHQGVRRHQCPHCESKFLLKAHLSEHLKTHTGERPYACDRCDAKFARKQTLNEHINGRHLYRRPYKCKQCDSQFTDRSALRKHTLRKHIRKSEATPRSKRKVVSSTTDS